MTLDYMGKAHESPTVLMRGRLEGWGWKRQRFRDVMLSAQTVEEGTRSQRPAQRLEKETESPWGAVGTVIP